MFVSVAVKLCNNRLNNGIESIYFSSPALIFISYSKLFKLVSDIFIAPQLVPLFLFILPETNWIGYSVASKYITLLELHTGHCSYSPSLTVPQS